MSGGVYRINGYNSVRRLNTRRVVVSAGGFVPTDITGCVLWLDFSDADTMFTDAGTTKVNTDGQAIYQANDKSGNGNHVIQTTQTHRPLYKTGIQNSLSVSRYDGDGDHLYKSNVQLVNPTNGTWTVFSVMKRTGDTLDEQEVISQDHSIENRVAQFIRYNITTFYLKTIALNNGIPSLISYSSSDNINVTDFVIASAVCSTSQVQLFVNGSGKPEGLVTHGLQTLPSLLTIGTGRYNPNNPGQQDDLFGDICEIVFYNSALSNTNRQAVETYLNNKWAIY